MKISGFSFVKNGVKLYFPIKQVIESALPLVDEFIIAVGDCDPDDRSREEIASINSPKIKIIDTVWDLEAYPRGMENAHQTDIAKTHCTGDWLLYLQGDELIHEKDHSAIKKRCQELLDDTEVEGLLFNYHHFWGDYQHVHRSHGWYKKEIRIVRNDPDIHSWESAQSFRRIPNFEGENYRQQEGTYKLKVATVDAHIYHYGWVRPPSIMLNKKKALDTIHKGSKRVGEMYKDAPKIFDYGDMRKIPSFSGSHPQVMQGFIERFDWAEQLRYHGKIPDRPLFKHEKLKYRILSWVENNIMGGKGILGFKNYELLKR